MFCKTKNSITKVELSVAYSFIYHIFYWLQNLHAKTNWLKFSNKDFDVFANDKKILKDKYG